MRGKGSKKHFLIFFKYPLKGPFDPFEEIDVKPVDDTSAEVEKEINVEVIGLK